MLVSKKLKLIIILLVILNISSNYSFSNELNKINKSLKIQNCLLNYNLKIDKTRARKLDSWKNKIIKYSKRHYGELSWKLDPKLIVLHYTASNSFPWNLVNTDNFDNEEPGLSSHYVIDKTKIWEILPTNIRSRGAYGINHVAINIEMIAMDENDLYTKKETLDTTSNLVKCLEKVYSIPINKVYSHKDIAKMDKRIIPEVKDLIDSNSYGKIDPGEKNLNYIKNKIKNEK